MWKVYFQSDSRFFQWIIVWSVSARVSDWPRQGQSAWTEMLLRFLLPEFPVLHRKEFCPEGFLSGWNWYGLRSGWHPTGSETQSLSFLVGWIIRVPYPYCPEIGNRKSAFKGTSIPVVETFIIDLLECTHAPRGVIHSKKVMPMIKYREILRLSGLGLSQ